MDTELVNKAIKMFNKPEKWFAFLKLAEIQGDMVTSMFINLRSEMAKYFRDHKYSGFTFEFDILDSYNCNAGWYFKDTKICLYFHECNMVFWLNRSIYQNTENINVILQAEENKTVLESLFRVNRYNQQSDHIITEVGDWQFNSVLDGQFDKTKLAVYAYNETSLFLQQIIKKVENFCTNEQVIKIIKELHEKGKL